jgi:putative phage-type endonuclease
MSLNEEELYSSLLQLFYDYVELHPTQISEPSFEEDMVDAVNELLSIFFEDDDDKYDDYVDLFNDFVEIVLPFFYESNIYTRRSYSGSIILPKLDQCHLLNNNNNNNTENIIKKLEYLSTIPQPEQRTDEWYVFRNNLITASNAYKIFESQSQQNSLIYEKCISISNASKDDSVFSNVNTESTLHWGQKYEPLSVLFYEEKYNTKIGEFGCIKHRKYSFIGASPDGINIDQTNERYGRMLEIKNIVNRDITGIPKKEYWIQMQLQMETCDLYECDFLETRFVEYENEITFLSDSDSSLFTSRNGERKGVILYFHNNTTGSPLYIYTPLNMSHLEYEKWSETLIEEMINERSYLTWVRHIYWRLDEMSCILVTRNQKWFNDVVPIMSNFWDIIEKERITGYEHRAPVKRIPKPNMDLFINKIICE